VVGSNVTEYNICTGAEEGAAEQEAKGSQAGEPAAAGPNANDNEPNANPYRRFDYRVVAINAVGNSEPSNGIAVPGGVICRGCIWFDYLQAGAPTEAIGPAPQSITPTVGISSPLEGEIVSKELTVVANAFDTDGNGTLAKVELFDGATKVGELNGPAPYSVIWNNASNGPHTLTVKATDASGVSATSPAVHVTVTGAPSVTLTNPSVATVVTAPGSITLQATASDPENAVAKVEFYQDTVKLGEDATAPYSFAWNNIQAGSYNVTARVIDSAGLTASSVAVPLMANNPPTVELTSPVTGQVMAAPGSALLVANVADTDSAITKVDFYQGTTLIGTSTTFPYTFDWTTSRVAITTSQPR